jgi:hypothetical protein
VNLLNVLSQLTHIGCEIAVVAVVSSVVKRHRPDAYGSLFAWALGSLIAGIFFAGFYMLLPTMITQWGMSMSSYATVAGLVSLAHAGIEVALVLVLIKGLVAIAQPPRPPVVPSAGTYR